MNTFTITGTILFQNIGTGFWGIISDDNKKWRPVSMPSELQVNNKKVRITAKKASLGFSIFMWGQAVEIIDFGLID